MTAPPGISLGALLLLPVALYLEWRRSSRHGFLPLGPIRAGLVVLILVVAAYAPVKYLDQSVVPSSFRVLPEFSRPDVDFVSNGKVHLRFPHPVQLADLQFTEEEIPLRELLDHVENVSELRADIAWCGTSSTVLWGSYPIYISFRSQEAASSQIATRD